MISTKISISTTIIVIIVFVGFIKVQNDQKTHLPSCRPGSPLKSFSTPLPIVSLTLNVPYLSRLVSYQSQFDFSTLWAAFWYDLPTREEYIPIYIHVVVVILIYSNSWALIKFCGSSYKANAISWWENCVHGEISEKDKPDVIISISRHVTVQRHMDIILQSQCGLDSD